MLAEIVYDRWVQSSLRFRHQGALGSIVTEAAGRFGSGGGGGGGGGGLPMCGIEPIGSRILRTERYMELYFAIICE